MSEQLLDGRYLIEKVLSKGGFGRTFLAKDTKLPGDPICVVKQLDPATSQPELLAKAQKLFNQEAETLHTLGEHPQIPRLLAYFAENNNFYIVQEHIDGKTLSEELIPEKPWSEEQVLQFLGELLKILDFVHQNSVIHRDIKPSNIIRRENNELVLIDFGAVKKVTNQVHDRTIAIGTPAYIPLEQMNGQPDFCSDLYALGMLGIQTITGLSFAPHLGGGLNIDAQGEKIWQPYAKVSDGLAAILTKMVRKNYRDRYQSAKEVIQAIQNLETHRSKATVISRNPALLETKIISPNEHPTILYGTSKAINPVTPQNPDNDRTVIEQKFEQQNSLNQLNFFKNKKLLACSGIIGIILIAIIPLKGYINNLLSPTLSLDGQPVSANLGDKNICPNFNVACQEYLLQGDRGQPISIEMNSDSFDPSLVLFAPDGKQLEVNEDVSLDNWNSKITVDLPVNGKYKVVAKTSTQGESGNYSLKADIVKRKDKPLF